MLKEADARRFKNNKKNYRRDLLSSFDELGALNKEPEQKLALELKDYASMSRPNLISSPREGLSILFEVFGIGAGDAVFLPAYAPLELLREVIAAKAEPILVPIHSRAYTLDVRALQYAIKEVMSEAKFRSRAILAVDQFGLPCDFKALEQIAERYGMFLFDIAWEGPGSFLQKQSCGTFGHAGLVRFAADTTVRAMQRAAAIFVDGKEEAQIFRAVKSPGFHEKEGLYLIGRDSDIHPLEANYIYGELLRYRASEQNRKLEIAGFYDAQLQDLLDPPFIPAGFVSSRNSYPILLPEGARREDFRTQLAASGVESPLPAWYDLAAVCEKAEKGLTHLNLLHEAKQKSAFAERLILLPIHPYMTLEDARRTVLAVRKSWAELFKNN